MSQISSTTTLPPSTRQEVPPEDAPEEEAPCPVQESIKVIGRKWHLIILWELSQSSRGFNELKTATRGISAKMLSQSLTDLEDHGLVVRDVITERPLRVSYRLTEKAIDLTPMFEVLHGWGQRHGLVEEPALA